MVLKLINATEAKTGSNVLVDGAPCVVRTNDISKTGRHGHPKCRIEAIGIIDGKKRVFLLAGHDRLEVPLINKNKSQILSIIDNKASIMDLQNYETFEVPIIEELMGNVKEGDQVEYWDIEGEKIIKKKI